MRLTRAEALRRASEADHATLATLNSAGTADLVPVCFAIVGEQVAIPIDTLKPKASTPLGRIRNLERDPRATLLMERWDAADWTRLWWVRLSVRRTAPSELALAALVAALRDRYPQYRASPFSDVLVFKIERVVGWSGSEPSTRIG